MTRFERIYHEARWASGTGVLSGSGSTVKACSSLAQWIESMAGTALKILDLGCGDLEWLAEVHAIRDGRIAYHGVDVVPTLIAHHQRVFPWFSGECRPISELQDDQGSDLLLLKDVLFHLSTLDAESCLRQISTWPSWRWLAVTSHPGANNQSRPQLSGPAMAGFDVEATGLPLGKRVASFPRPDGGTVIVLDRLSEPV